MPARVGIHVPWPRLDRYRDVILEKGFHPEFFIPAESLDSFDEQLATTMAADLAAADLRCTVHAVFMDLNPGSIDPRIREVSRQRMEQTLRAAGLLRADIVVVHPGYHRIMHGSIRQQWVDNSVSFWQGLLPQATDAGCRVALENIFEEDPATLHAVLTALSTPSVGHCFDCGHFNMFGTVSWDIWFESLGTFLIECHLHDNHGHADEHLPVGAGLIDFPRLLPLIERTAPQAVWTLEAHSLVNAERSLEAITRLRRGLV